MNTPKKRSIYNVSFLAASIFIHAILLLLFLFNDSKSPWTDLAQQKKYEPTVQFLDISQKDKLEHKSLVEQDEKDKPTKNKPKDAKFMSKVDKEVLKETRALNRGDFKNENSKVPSPPVVEQPKPQDKKQQVAKSDEKAEITKTEMKTFAHGDLMVGKKSEKTPTKAKSISDLHSNSMQEMQQQAFATASQTNDYIKDVAIGVETQLSTREFLYYTYFNRIKKKLRQSWEPIIQDKVKGLVRKGRDIASNATTVTRLVITLDAQGGLSRVQVQTTSGLQDLDEAAIEALKVSAPFPNPPTDLIVDGYVLINWDFILES
jgi:protein TonB